MSGVETTSTAGPNRFLRRHGARAGRKAEVLRQAYTIPEFLEAYRISRTTLYELWKQGLGPKKFNAGAKVLITTSAAAKWAEGQAA